MSKDGECNDYPGCREGKDIFIGKNDCEINVNITTENLEGAVIWGYVQDTCNRHVKHAKITLLKYIGKCRSDLKPICHTFTDANGFYKFKLPVGSCGRHRVVVSKCETEFNENCHCNQYECHEDHCDRYNERFCYRESSCDRSICGYSKSTISKQNNVYYY